jgi:hypothetical protein
MEYDEFSVAIDGNIWDEQVWFIYGKNMWFIYGNYMDIELFFVHVEICVGLRMRMIQDEP